MRQIRTFSRNQTFAVRDLVHLLDPFAALLSTRSRQLKEDWIDPLQIKVVQVDPT